MTKTPIRVLVVDDHLIVRQGIRALLAESEDIEVVGEASNGLEAVRQAGRTKPDVILMDLIMPEMGGEELAEEISNINPEIKVLLCSGYTHSRIFMNTPPDERKYFFITKPYSIQSLQKKIRKILD